MALPLAVALAGAAPAADAEPGEGSTLTWHSVPGCPDAATVRGGVETLLGTPLDAPRPGAVDARGVVRATENRAWVLELTIATATGSRTRLYSAPTCGELADLAAVLIAVAIDPTVDADLPVLDPRRADVVEAPTFPESTPVVKTAPAPAPVTDVPAPAEPPRKVRGAVRVAAGVSVGPLPDPAPGVHLGAGVVGRGFRAELIGGYWFAREARLTDEPGAGGDVRAWAIGVRGCGVPRFKIVELPACGAVELGAMRAEGVGVEDVTAERLLWAAARAGIGLWVVPIPHFGVGLDADLVVPLTRPGFEIDGLGEVHRAAPVGFFGLFGLEARFP